MYDRIDFSIGKLVFHSKLLAFIFKLYDERESSSMDNKGYPYFFIRKIYLHPGIASHVPYSNITTNYADFRYWQF